MGTIPHSLKYQEYVILCITSEEKKQKTQKHLGNDRSGRFKLPSVAAQLLLQLCDLVEFVEEPLVDGRQLVDVIDAHAAMEGLVSGQRERKKV